MMFATRKGCAMLSSIGSVSFGTVMFAAAMIAVVVIADQIVFTALKNARIKYGNALRSTAHSEAELVMLSRKLERMEGARIDHLKMREELRGRAVRMRNAIDRQIGEALLVEYEIGNPSPIRRKFRARVFAPKPGTDVARGAPTQHPALQAVPSVVQIWAASPAEAERVFASEFPVGFRVNRNDLEGGDVDTALNEFDEDAEPPSNAAGGAPAAEMVA
jgi:hypothetical protein